MKYQTLLSLLVLLFTPLAQAAPFEDAECLDCHGVEGFGVPSEGEGFPRLRRLDLDADALSESVHGKLACTDCHTDIEEVPHRKGDLGTVDCVECHERLTGEAWSPGGRSGWLAPEPPRIVLYTEHYQDSIHADQSVPGNASCATCHTAHYVYPSEDPRALTYRLNSPEMCGECHQEAYRAYRNSIHGASIRTPWKGESATCSDCHSSHSVTDLKKTAAHRLVTRNCGDCHLKEVEGYMSSTHGQLAWHGNPDAARCKDCHRAHDTRSLNDPAALVAKDNKLQTCRECHEEANEQFIQYHPHGTTKDFAKYPVLWLFGKGMAVLIIAVLLFFYTHSLLWFRREKQLRPVKWVKSDYWSVPVREKRKKPHSGVHFRRFHWAWRLNHWALALSVMTLVFTGMTVMYPDTDWATSVVELVGGPTAFGLIHRTAGVIFLTAIFGHAIVVLARVLRDPEFQWFGPDSLLPRKKDWEDMKGQFRWFFGKGEQPRFDRWTYWEKFDYWAVYWGAFVIGLSGVLLWFSDEVGQVLPGWIFNIATIAHGLEAFLAVLTLFVVHFFNNHFRPSKFPLDTVMFTGSWDLEELKEERPEAYERLKASGELEKHLVPPPSRRANIVSHILGFTLLGIGLILLILVINGFIERGLV
ncbi:MAG TPA: cytochrome C [Thiotrichales bacterium]|nr:cytochrome C [Thiotrichales bacterium]